MASHGQLSPRMGAGAGLLFMAFGVFTVVGRVSRAGQQISMVKQP